MLISDDFFTYMSSASLPLLIDTTIFCVLAMNDNGQAPYIQDPRILSYSILHYLQNWYLEQTMSHQVQFYLLHLFSILSKVNGHYSSGDNGFNQMLLDKEGLVFDQKSIVLFLLMKFLLHIKSTSFITCLIIIVLIGIIRKIQFYSLLILISQILTFHIQ